MHRSSLGFAAALLIAWIPRPGTAQISDDVVRIGVLTDLSGPASDATGAGSVLGAEMAVADFGGEVAGKPIQVISANHQLKPDIGAQIKDNGETIDPSKITITDFSTASFRADVFVDLFSELNLSIFNVQPLSVAELFIHTVADETVSDPGPPQGVVDVVFGLFSSQVFYDGFTPVVMQS